MSQVSGGIPGLASSSQAGLVSTGTQTFSGDKTFTGNTAIAGNTASVATIGNASSSAIHVLNGAQRVTTRTITANLTIDTTTTDWIIYCNQSGAINVTLPAPTNGRFVLIKDISGNAATNNITLVRNGTERIEGVAASRTLQTNWGSWLISSNGTDWFIH